MGYTLGMPNPFKKRRKISRKKVQRVKDDPGPIKRPGRTPWLVEFPERVAVLYQHIREGARPQQACDLIGLSAQRFSEWRAKGKADLEQGLDTCFARFAEEIPRLQAQHFQEAYGSVMKGIRGFTETVTEIIEAPDGTTTKQRTQEVFKPELAFKLVQALDPAGYGNKQEVKHSGEVTTKRIILQGPDPREYVPESPRVDAGDAGHAHGVEEDQEGGVA